MFPPITLEILVICIGIVLLLVDSFKNGDHAVSASRASIFCLFWVLVWSFFLKAPDSIVEGSYLNFYSVDHFSLFFKRLALVCTIGVLVIAGDYVGSLTSSGNKLNAGVGAGAFFSIPLFTCAGLMFMASSRDLVTAFVSLELVTISLYVLVAYTRTNSDCLESGVKYLILGALGTGFLAYGLTWMFGLTGETQFSLMGPKLARLEGQEPAVLFTFALIFVGIGFKVAAAPFHWWVADVYQGAPTPITAYLSVGSKSAGFLLLLRLLEPFLTVPGVREKVMLVVAFSTVATLIYGNVGALPQTNFKRLLAYSSIGHAGYLLMAVASVKPTTGAFQSVGACVGFYLLGYLLMTILAFLVYTLVSAHTPGNDLSIFNGLSIRSPFLSFALLISMCSLAGVPFTVGFYGKFLVFAHSLQAGNFLLTAFGVLAVASGFYYYLRVIASSWWHEPTVKGLICIPLTTKLLICVLMVAIVFLGIVPRSVINYLAYNSVG